MPSLKESRLAHIQDEVADLHPLLAKLLPKLPNVLDVEYTHGPSEMGADFVLKKKGDTFANTEYIGVIAKVGKVVQDFGDIERQIDECSVPRLYFDGKEKIRIEEIWVVITEHVTGGAQQKIHDKYKTRKIIFVNGSRLENLIDTYFPIFWTNVDLEIGAYLSELRAGNLEADRRMSLLPIQNKSFYVEPEIVRRERRSYKSNLKKANDPVKIDIHAEIEKRDLVFIEGWMGLGKSKLLRELINHYTNYTNPEVYKRTGLLPVGTTFKELLDNHQGDIAKLIQTKTQGRLIAKELKTKYLVFIDGVDEKDLPVDEQVRALAKLVADIHDNPDINAVICSRDLKALEQPGIFRSDDYAYEIRPLTLQKTIEFLRLLCSHFGNKDRLLQDLKKSPLFRELPRSPISAILLSQLLNENPADLPSNMTELYSKYLELMLGRWDYKKGLQSQKEYRALDSIMMSVAQHMVDNELLFLSIEDAKHFFKDYLKRKNFGISGDDLFQKTIDRCELIAMDPSGNTMTFKHRTFVEFFYAKNSLKKKSLAMDNQAFQPYWSNVYFFFIGLLQDCPDELNALVDLAPNSEYERWGKLFSVSSYLLAGYTTDYGVISNGVEKAAIDAAQLYLDTINRKSDTPFAMFPPMATLYIVQAIMRNAYGYEFFQSAIESAAMNIEVSSLSDDIKAYALFFLSVTLATLGHGSSFDFLLKPYFGRLPLDVSMALMIEEKNVPKQSALLKKQDKHVRRMLRDSRSLRDTVKNLFEKPVKYALPSHGSSEKKPKT